MCVIHCWVCNKKGSVKQFLRDSNIEFEDGDILPRKKEEKVITEVKLPDCKNFRYSNTKAAQTAKEYLITRGVDDQIIDEWEFKIGTGHDVKLQQFDYFGYLIVPLYGLKGIEYFIAARYMDGKGYKLPEGTKDKFVPKRRGARSLVLVEGLFDATAIWKHTKFDVCMLMGKYLMKKQTEMLLKTGYDEVYCCLDGDAMDANLAIAWRLSRAGQKMKVVNLPQDKDPNDLQENVLEYIKNASIFKPTDNVIHRIERIRAKRTL